MRQIVGASIFRCFLVLGVLGIAACNNDTHRNEATNLPPPNVKQGADSKGSKTATNQKNVGALIKNEKLGVTGYVSGNLTLPSSSDKESIVRNYATQNGASLNVGNDVSVIKSFVNDRDETIVKVQQTLNGVPVEGTLQAYTVAKDGVLKAVSGVNLPDLQLKDGSSFTLSSEEAIEIAKSELNRSPQATDEYSASQVILHDSANLGLSAIKVLVSFSEPAVEAWEITIDATDGQVLSKRTALYNEAVTMTGTGPYGDKRTLQGWKGEMPQLGITPTLPYALIDVTRQAPGGRGRADGLPLSVQTYEHTPASDAFERVTRAIASDDNGTILAGYVSETANNYHAVDAHYYMGKFVDFLRERFNRFSFNDQGDHLIATCHSLFSDGKGGRTPNNAGFSSVTNQIYIGDGDGSQFGSFANVETIGHEFTHAVIQSEAELPYVYETGAVNEGLADFFGEVFGEYADGIAPDWKKMAQEYTPNVSGDAYLDYKNPQANGFPDHLENRYKDSKDNLGVHRNAAILTKAFSLMSDGGTFHTVTVPAIGMEKLSRILYDVIVERLTPQTNFEQLAAAAVDMSAALYGTDSIEYKSVRTGFYAVGIQNNVEQWDYLTESPFQTGEEFGGVALGDKVYVVGGSRGLVGTSKETWEYDIATNTWTRKSDMPSTRIFPRVVTAHDKIYVVNGYTDDAYNVPGTTIDQYDPATDQWQTVGELPTKVVVPTRTLAPGETLMYEYGANESVIRIKTGTLPSGGSLHVELQVSNDDFETFEVIGSGDLSKSNYDYHISRFSSSCRLVFTAVGQSAEVALETVPYRGYAPVVAEGDNIYIVGGTLGYGTMNRDGMDRFDIVNKTWTMDLPGPVKARHSASATVATVGGKSKLMLFFGFHNGEYLREIDSYDISSGEWSVVGSIPEGVKLLDASPVFYRNKLHFVGGSTTDGTLWGTPLGAPSGGSTLVYDVDNGNWYTNQLLGMPSNNGISTVSRDSIVYVSSPDPFSGIYNPPSLRVTAFDPLRINVIDSDSTATLRWSKFDNSTQSKLIVDGTPRYTGTGTEYLDSTWYGAPRKRVSQAQQEHPIYGSITSKNLCTSWEMVGDVNEDGVINANDVSLLGAATQGGTVLSRLAQVAADIDGNNVVNSEDLGLLSTYVMTHKTTPRIGQKIIIVFGDLTNDGKVDYRDALRLDQGILGTQPLSLSQVAAADVDGNQRLNTTDVSYIKRYTLNHDVVFPVVK
jgi:thermolysin